MPSLPGRQHHSRILADDNVEEIAEHLRQILKPGHRFVWTAVNEFFGYEPEIRFDVFKGVRVTRIGQPLRYADGGAATWCGFTVDTDYGIAAVHSSLATRPAWITDYGYAIPDPRRLFGFRPPTKYDLVQVELSDEAVRVEHHAPAGHRLIWQFTALPVDHCRWCGADIPEGTCTKSAECAPYNAKVREAGVHV